MDHEKILKREDGNRIKIMVNFINNRIDVPTYYVCVLKCASGKRKFNGVVDCDNYEYRRLNSKDRIEWLDKRVLKHVTKKEILEAKLELWGKLKPT